jgi:hypothetical protein
MKQTQEAVRSSGISAVSLGERLLKLNSYGLSSCVVGWVAAEVRVLWVFKLCRWLSGFWGSSLQGSQDLSLVEWFLRFNSFGISSCVAGWVVSEVPFLWDFKLCRLVEGFLRFKSYGISSCVVWLRGFWGSSLMGFQAVSLVEWFLRFKSYGISSCVVGWGVSEVQVLWDFKLCRWLRSCRSF